MAITPATDLGTATALVCRECGSTRDLGPYYACEECFGPLEIKYDFGDLTRADIESGPRNIWRYRGLLPVPSNIADTPNTEPGLTRLVRADNLAESLGLQSLWV
ncbi:MAG: threonine synthase, partial [Actinomycetes bacterium]